jgi:ankyrin repeat protein
MRQYSNAKQPITHSVHQLKVNVNFSISHRGMTLTAVSSKQTYASPFTLRLAQDRELCIDFVMAANEGDVRKAQQILAKSNVDINTVISCHNSQQKNIGNLSGSRWPDTLQFSALHAAIFNSHSEMLEFLCQLNNIDLEVRDVDGKTPLSLACYTQRNDMAKFLIEKGAKIDAPSTKELLTPLHYACTAGNLELAQLCLDHGSMQIIDARSAMQQTALHKAILSGNIKLVALLLEKGADHSAIEISNNAPIHFAVLANIQPAASLAICKLLVKYGAQPDLEREGYENQQRKPSDLAKINGKNELAIYLESIKPELTSKQKLSH